MNPVSLGVLPVVPMVPVRTVSVAASIGAVAGVLPAGLLLAMVLPALVTNLGVVWSAELLLSAAGFLFTLC